MQVVKVYSDCLWTIRIAIYLTVYEIQDLWVRYSGILLYALLQEGAMLDTEGFRNDKPKHHPTLLGNITLCWSGIGNGTVRAAPAGG